MAKRSLDVLVALVGLLCASPLLGLIAVLIKLDSKGPLIFKQIRVGRNFRPFAIYKFRTMVANHGPAITPAGDIRVTRIGRLLRRMKLDELPQFVNVLKGDMSLVGPRPEVPKYVALFEPQYRKILSVRPGMTDFASLKYRDEASFLSGSDDPEREYVTRILPDKLRLAEQYTERASLTLDVLLIVKTLLPASRQRASA